MKQLSFLLAGLFLSLNMAFAQKKSKSFERIEQSGEAETQVINQAENHPEDFKANYNAAAHFYNLAVESIDKIDSKRSDKELRKVQEDAIQMFRTALPYAKKANELDPNNNITLHMLSGIYFGLNEIELSEEYEKMALKAEGIDSN